MRRDKEVTQQQKSGLIDVPVRRSTEGIFVPYSPVRRNGSYGPLSKTPESPKE